MAKRTGKAKIVRLKSLPKKNILNEILIFLGKPFFVLLLFCLSTIDASIKFASSVTIVINKTVLKIFLWLKKPKKQKKVIYKSRKTIPQPIKTKKPRLKTTFGFLGFITGTVLSLLAIYYLTSTIIKDLPSPAILVNRPPSFSTKILDRNGKLLYKIYLNENRSFVPLDQIPLFVRQATIAIEDKDYYRHNGLSLAGIVRALYQNIFLGRRAGGSTITQQLVKNVLLTSQKTLSRKIKELILAILTEKKYSKDQILEMYLNRVGYGGAAYGIEEASQKYFGKSVKNINLAEAALLAGLPVSPTRYSPFGNNPQIAKERQINVLRRMAEDGYITEETSNKAKQQKLNFITQKEDIFAPHFVMYVKDLLVTQYGEQAVEKGGLEVTTSLDLDIQEKTQKIVFEEIQKLGNLHITNGAALIINPKTGELLAMVGSKDYFAKDIDGNVNVTIALRQPGSSIKPINYSLALENGFTPASVLEDSPITYQIPGQEPYSPKNYDNQYHGRVTLRTALGSSYNIPAVKILASLGVQKMLQRGKEMGITTWSDPSQYGLSLTLGGGEVKMTELATAYGVLANNGIKVELNPILEIKNNVGKTIFKNPQGKETPVLPPAVAFLLTDILSDNQARTPAFGPSSKLFFPNRQVAVKTGTTQKMRDNWTVGYTPSLLTAVWVGNNDSSPMSYVASGVTGASPIWRNIMDYLLANQSVETFTKPEDIVEVEICSLTGTLTCSACPNTRKEYFVSGTEPKYGCTSEKIKEILENKKNVTPTPQIL